ncbi:hypothetical protein ATI61_106310 [Archangium gephyra]|uniref:NACHT domain-containing protein n=1 Tax=Archangium gephyra TaxID=48 RepID=A0AAC8Q0U7_9BACT|nr:hypothetical protein [Archangium gephyra]AKI98929.1 Hypothetical protein AA314_00556 [Archangium gephyra]REG30840.1 hypothetical protein ATI61_106310 [Archangium gephyra]
MTPEESRTRAWAVLLEEKPLPKQPPGRKALAVELPRLVEEICCTRGGPREAAARGLTRIWNALESDELTHPEFGTPQLGAGCLEAATLLGLQLPSRQAPAARGFTLKPIRDVDLSSHHSLVARPHVLALLANDAPARVLHTGRAVEPTTSDDAIRDTAVLVRQFLGIATPQWTFDRAAPGRSKMAALVLRAILELWPEAAERLDPDKVRRARGDRLVFGVTGELDPNGLALPVDGLSDKVARFFGEHPNGLLLVPAAQWQEAKRYDRRIAVPAAHSWPDSEHLRKCRIEPFRSVLDLLVRLGLSLESCPGTQLFEKLRQGSRRVTCWNGEVRDISATLDRRFVTSIASKDEEDQGSFTQDEPGFLSDVHSNHLSGEKRPCFIEGGPGDGKSIVLRRLAAYLLQEVPLLGPALRVDARQLADAGFSLAEALASTSQRTLDTDGCRHIVQLAQSQAMEGSVWLLVDGLDEVSPSARLHILELIADWPGPTIVGARPLPDEVPGAPHFRVCPLELYDQQKLFELEGKPHYWKLLRDESGDRFHSSVDRRKEMLTDLCSTPLGVSLLAMLPETMFGESLDVPKVLQACIIRLLERAEGNQRITAQVRRRVANSGLGVLGGAAWSMLRRGEAVLTREDLEILDGLGPPEVVDAVHEALEKSDLVQRVGPGLSQFSHKSLAEFCAAIYLVRRKEAEEELLVRIGEPGPDAVAFHFGALLTDRQRLTQFIHALANNPHRPMSSLALATRLLIANGPERVAPEAAIDVLRRRVRLASRLDRLPLPGGLDDLKEMWLAIERWAATLRPHTQELIAACPAAVGRFLRGELPPLQDPRRGHGSWSERRVLHEACDFAEKLVMKLGLRDLPLSVLTRFREGMSLLLERPAGSWAIELETLFDAPSDEQRTNPSSVALSVWAQRAPAGRHLERLDALSRGTLVEMQPVIRTVLAHGSMDQKREALLRAAACINTGLARHAKEVPPETWLSQWELLWASGLVGDTSKHSTPLEPLYAEFLHDRCGLARWRALVARVRLQVGGRRALLRSVLHDRFKAVRIEALARIAKHKISIEPAHIATSLSSMDDDERWVAFAAINTRKRVPTELLLAALVQTRPPRPVVLPFPSARETPETPWEKAMRKHAEKARSTLVEEVRARLGDEQGIHTFFELLDGPYADVVEDLVSGWWGFSRPLKLIRELLATGSPRQRRFAARFFISADLETLAPYVNDADPEIAALARKAVEEHQRRMKAQADGARHAAQQIQTTSRFISRMDLPKLSPEVLSRYDTFEELWNALPQYDTLPPFNRPLAPYRMTPTRYVASAQSQLMLERMLLLYRPHHQQLVLAGLENEALAPISVAILREQLPVDEVLSLLSKGGAVLEHAIAILIGTPHAATGARCICDELRTGRIQVRPRRDGAAPEAASPKSPTISVYWENLLSQLDGIAAFLPLLEEGTPKPLMQKAIVFIQQHWKFWEQSTPSRTDILDRAHSLEVSSHVQVREIALRLLAIVGSAEDAALWRPVLMVPEVPPRVLAAAVRLVGRQGTKEDLPLFRSLLACSPEVAGEAVIAMAHTGGNAVLEELIALVESPPEILTSASTFHWHPNAPWAGWRHAIAKTVIQQGDGAQARRLAIVMTDDDAVWKLASEYIRLPEHLLFMAGHLSRQDPVSEDSDGYEQAHRVLKGMIEQVGAEPARRLMLEASLWGEPFREAFEDLVRKVHPSDMELLVTHLREHPDDRLALYWMSHIDSGEESLDAVWREKAVPWWC